MMHYKKGKNIEEELTRDNIAIECLPEDFLWMHVKGGTKVSNVVDYAKKALDSGEYRNIVWSGSEGGVGKTISCAEIMKRKYDLHQITRICYRKVEEYWDPQMEGLEQIIVNRRIPCIHILLSLDPLDTNLLGYQHSRAKTKLYDETINNGDKKTGTSYEDKHRFQKNKHSKNQKSFKSKKLKSDKDLKTEIQT